MTALWIAAIVVFGVVEAVTAGLVSIWFVPGAVAGLSAAMAGAGLLIQLVLFLAVSAAALAATRPLVKKLSAGRAVPTNADRVLGRTARVTETIDNDSASGAVYVDGKTWTARSADGSVLPAGSRVVAHSCYRGDISVATFLTPDEKLVAVVLNQQEEDVSFVLNDVSNNTLAPITVPGKSITTLIVEE